MNQRGTAPFAALLAVALAGGVGVTAQSVEADRAAPEQPNHAVGRPAAPIDGARKDFEAVKSLRDFGVETKGELPRVSVPNMPTGAVLSLPVGTTKKADAGKRSPTWLADAMEKHAAARGVRGSDERLSEKGGELNENREPGEKRERVERREQRSIADDENTRQDRNRTPNPFAAYLGAWLTPQDLALLQPALEHSSARESLRPGMPSASPSGDDFPIGQGSGGLVPLTRDPLPAPRINASGATRENPYLEVVGSTLPVQSIAPKGNASAVSAATGGIASPAQVPQAVPASKIPDFVRPNSDERYFKQLKRF